MAMDPFATYSRNPFTAANRQRDMEMEQQKRAAEESMRSLNSPQFNELLRQRLGVLEPQRAIKPKKNRRLLLCAN